ncbi:MAG: hypothetical protein RRB13_07335 [bacterium]|nr:hypothetical protein [bacterium]
MTTEKNQDPNQPDPNKEQPEAPVEPSEPPVEPPQEEPTEPVPPEEPTGPGAPDEIPPPPEEPLTPPRPPEDEPFDFTKRLRERPFNLIAFFFAPFYYIGYGQIVRGIAFFFLSLIPVGAILVSFWAGFRANKELPIGEVPFNWRNVGLSLAGFTLLVILLRPQIEEMFGPNPQGPLMGQSTPSNLEGRLGFSPEIFCSGLARRGGLRSEPICLRLERGALEQIGSLNPSAENKQLCLQYAQAAGGSNQLLLNCLLAPRVNPQPDPSPIEPRNMAPRFSDPLRSR